MWLFDWFRYLVVDEVIKVYLYMYYVIMYVFKMKKYLKLI